MVVWHQSKWHCKMNSYEVLKKRLNHLKPSETNWKHLKRCNTPPHFFKIVGVLEKCVDVLNWMCWICRFFGKISWSNVVGKFGVFYHKKQNVEFYQYSVPQKSNFYRRWRLIKKSYKICTGDYDNNEYLAVKYIRFFTINIIWCLWCNVYQWAETMIWKWSYNTDANSLVKQH